MSEYLRAWEVAEMLVLSPATVVDMAEDGRLPAYRIGGRKGGRLRFRRDEVELVVDSWRIKPVNEGGPE